MKRANNAPPPIPPDVAELAEALDALPEKQRAAAVGWITRTARATARKPRSAPVPRRPAPTPDGATGWIGTLRSGLVDREPVRGLGHPSRAGEPHGLASKLEELADLSPKGDAA